MRYASAPGPNRGFSLVEVMVALIVICVGLLGIAKLEALMLSGTGTSRLRALVALQAESLADAMHANRDYWGGGSPTYWDPASGALSLTATETNGATTFAGTNAPAAGDDTICQESAPASGVAACTSVQLADRDLSVWADDMQAVLRNSQSAINCSATNGIVSCTIAITWNENTVAANSQEVKAGAPAGFQQQTYTLAVDP